MEKFREWAEGPKDNSKENKMTLKCVSMIYAQHSKKLIHILSQGSEAILNFLLWSGTIRM